MDLKEYHFLENRECPVFRPSFEEFKDFKKYVKQLELKENAINYGIVKIVPPSEWSGFNLFNEHFYQKKLETDFTIRNPILQEFTGDSGIFKCLNLFHKSMKIETFMKKAQLMDKKIQNIKEKTNENIEKLFWSTISGFNPSIYGADMKGSFFDSSIKEWNLNLLPMGLKEITGKDIMGVTVPYMYFGMWKASFSWHTEDKDLYSINYLHFGEPKTWYGISSNHYSKMIDYCKSSFPEEFRKCPEFMRHKQILISPNHLRNNNIPFYKTVQRSGEFVITFPKCFHAGFNWGFNCAEAVNFSTKRWVEYGKVPIHFLLATSHFSTECQSVQMR